MPETNVLKHDASGKKASCHVADAFLTRLKLIWPISSLKISKMSKKCVLGQKLQESMCLQNEIHCTNYEMQAENK